MPASSHHAQGIRPVDMTVQSIDTQLLLAVNHGMANALFDVLMPALSQRGYLLVVPFLFGMLLWGAREQGEKGKMFLSSALWAFLIACCAVYLSGFAENWMKEAVARVRPCRAIVGIRLITSCPKSYSMPSGHSISSFAFAAPLFLLMRPYIALAWRLYPLLLASAIAFSRLYLGVHYPTDVLVGAGMGACVGLALSCCYLAIGTGRRRKEQGGP